MNDGRTQQEHTWIGSFGEKYTRRNIYDPAALDKFYEQTWGISRSKINQEFLADVPKDAKILEVGANVGNQLRCLQSMGFKHLTGIELQDYAVKQARELCPTINLIQGSAFELPFEKASFDLIFTSGVLIHISPDDIEIAIQEIYRCSKKYIWGFEYYAETPEALPYQGQESLLWKRNFAGYYLDTFRNLELVKEARYPYTKNANLVDAMFLLRKRSAL